MLQMPSHATKWPFHRKRVQCVVSVYYPVLHRVFNIPRGQAVNASAQADFVRYIAKVLIFFQILERQKPAV